MPVATLERIGREFAGAAPSLALPTGPAASADADEAVLRLNAAAGNVGRTYLLDRPHALTAAAAPEEMAALVSQMRGGSVGLLLLRGANPAYELPAALDFSGAASHVPAVVSFSGLMDETTARYATLILPDHAPLESWGEYTPRPGITGLMQPVAAPVFDTRATGDLLLTSAAALGHNLGATEYRAYLQRALKLDEEVWLSAVERGGIFADKPEPAAIAPAVATAAQPAAPAPAAKTAGLTLHVYPSLHFYDGRTAHLPFLQELPDPMAKAVWGSWAEVHPETASRLGIADDDLLSLRTDAGRLEVPALVTDRVHPDVIALPLGQGHTEYGRYAQGIGVNAWTLLPAKGGALTLSGVPVDVARLSARRKVVRLQTSTRDLTGKDAVAKATTLTELAAKAGVESERQDEEKQPHLYHYAPPGKRRWGMVIDLDRCIGCNACAAACYAENNVPVVGRDECGRGREMAWLRIENYGGPQKSLDGTLAPGQRFLPMLCQQCEDAPCEYVCPVNATVHSPEGLNQQVYNRCVGTRFCANNCPYKVRRFNWYTFAIPSPLDQSLNPDVIRRTKGVMEKCTFCVQRIRHARIDAEVERRPIRDGEVQTACQQTCPTDAIVFGDLNDPNSRVRALAADPRGYGALAHLNTHPSVTYLARVENPAGESGSGGAPA